MIDFHDARKIAQEHIKALGARHNRDLVLHEGCEIEFSLGWVFFYNSRDYVIHGNRRAQLFGNAPVIVDRESGEIRVTGTAKPIQNYIEDYCVEKGQPPDRA
jgi:hypothetical protein